MAEVVQSAVLWMGSLLIQEASMLLEVDDQVQDLQEELEFMLQYLRDAEAKRNDREVRTLILQIRKLAYDAEDVIDTYILKVHPKTLESDGPDGNWLLRFACVLYNTPGLHGVRKQIGLIQSRINRITERLDAYGVRRVPELQEGVRLSHDERYWRNMAQRCSYDDDNAEYVVGLEKDIPKLLEVLIGEGQGNANVVSIVGMGGSGKTTLARKLYNHPFVRECFDCAAWVFISQEWNTRHVLSEILRKVGGPKETTEVHARLTMEEVVDKLRGILKKKSYLVVLDDVWKRDALREILPALPRGQINGGSKIIITTRNKEIIEYKELNCNLYTFEPQPLSEAEGWELFSKIALSHRDRTKSFERLGKEMLNKCDGLPLAIVALAGILNTKGSITQWQKVSETVRSRVMEGTGVGELLALSYDDLPYRLKPCFLYLGVFPEDCLMPAGMLTRMWIAEGFVNSHSEISLEDVATQCLEELSHRFLIQIVRTNLKGEIKAVRVHDLLRDLCIKLAKEQSFLEIHNPAYTNDLVTRDVATQTRRAALHSSTIFPTQVPNLRSLVFLTRSSVVYSAYAYKERLDLEQVCRNFKLLRMLNLWGIKTDNGGLPSQIGSLIHLRYLGIRATNIAELPASIGSLRNLLTLDYRNVESNNNMPIKIPNILCKLVALRHLFLPIESPWSINNLNLSALKNLQILCGLKQDGEADWLSRELGKLSSNLKKLKLGVSTKRQLSMAFSCPSLVADALQTLYCELRHGLALRDVEPFFNNQHLHKLVLSGIIQMQLPLILPVNLIVLELKDSMLDEDPMPALGVLAHLKHLSLINSFVGNTLCCELGSFPQLEELYLSNLQNLDSWRICKGAMLCLKKLQITACSNLHKFPDGLRFVTTLQQIEFFGMSEEFDLSAMEYGWSQRRLRLPHNCEIVIRQCDSPVDFYPISKLYEQLVSGVYLNDKMKRYWVAKQDGCYYNCFMMYAMDLTFADSDFWDWTEMAESDGAFIKVAKLKPTGFVLDVSGRFKTAYLSPDISYRIFYIIMLEESACGFTRPVDCTLSLSDHRSKKRSEPLNVKPRNEWLRIFAGEVKMPSRTRSTGDLTFSLRLAPEWPPIIKGGMVVKGVAIEPKL